MTGIFLLAAAIPLAAFIRHRLEPRRYVVRPPRLLTDDDRIKPAAIRQADGGQAARRNATQ